MVTNHLAILRVDLARYLRGRCAFLARKWHAIRFAPFAPFAPTFAQRALAVLLAGALLVAPLVAQARALSLFAPNEAPMLRIEVGPDGQCRLERNWTEAGWRIGRWIAFPEYQRLLSLLRRLESCESEQEITKHLEAEQKRTIEALKRTIAALAKKDEARRAQIKNLVATNEQTLEYARELERWQQPWYQHPVIWFGVGMVLGGGFVYLSSRD